MRGFELEVPYSEDLDLDGRIKDKSVIFAPTVFGSVTYRPNDWLETRVELTFEQLFPAQEQDPLTLPDGTLQPADETPPSLLVDQLFARFTLPPIRDSIPVKFTLGRVNFEDLRLSLYDAALDAAMFSFKPGACLAGGGSSGTVFVLREGENYQCGQTVVFTYTAGDEPFNVTVHVE